MLQAYGNLRPQIDPAARVAETAVVVGEVSVEAGASLWYGAVLRGDEAPIRVGRDSNIQDNVFGPIFDRVSQGEVTDADEAWDAAMELLDQFRS